MRTIRTIRREMLAVMKSYSKNTITFKEHRNKLNELNTEITKLLEVR